MLTSHAAEPLGESLFFKAFRRTKLLSGAEDVSVCSLKLEAKMKDSAKPKNGSFVPGDENKKALETNFEVGYCKPPLHTRFQKNRSGNIKGRPKERLSKRALELTLEKVLYKKVTLKSKEGRLPEEVSALEALILDSLHRGLKGDAREKKNLFDLILKLAADDAAEAPTESAAEDEAILSRHNLALRGHRDDALSVVEGSEDDCEAFEEDGGGSC